MRVDRPDLRNSTYPTVEAGRRIDASFNVASHRAAIAAFNDVLAGAWDFASEYAVAVSVTATDGTKRRSVRTFWVREDRAKKWATHEEAAVAA